MSMPGKYDKTLLEFIKERMGGVGTRNANFIAKDVTRINGLLASVYHKISIIAINCNTITNDHLSIDKYRIRVVRNSWKHNPRIAKINFNTKIEI